MEALLNERPVERIMNRMRILSPYHEHYDFVRQMLRSSYNLNHEIGRTLKDAIGTVSSRQGLEEDLMIFMIGRPLGHRPLGSDSFLDNIPGRYVMMMREK